MYVQGGWHPWSSGRTSAHQISIQPGHIARHTPRNAGAQGREAAVVDIAQDLLLREPQENCTLAFVAAVDGLSIGLFSYGAARGTNAERLVELS